MDIKIIIETQKLKIFEHRTRNGILELHQLFCKVATALLVHHRGQGQQAEREKSIVNKFGTEKPVEKR